MKINNKLYKNKILLVTGGTGTFGKAVIDHFIKTNISEIRVFSRDEKKQYDMREKLEDIRIKYIIGDVKDKSSVDKAVYGSNYIFHAAALKQVPSCEFYPYEAYLTNVLGTENVVQSSIEQKVEKVVFLSTDKSVYPINAMGLSKAMAEKIIISKAILKNNKKTNLTITRYGNVLLSRGSILSKFHNQIKKNLDITITHKDMTRFIMKIEDAVDLVLHAFNYGKQGEIFVQKSNAIEIYRFARLMKQYFNSKSKIRFIGVRHSEKLHETLVSHEEMINSKETKNYIKIEADVRGLNYDNYTDKGSNKNLKPAYSSKTSKKMNDKEIISLLDEIKNDYDSNE